LLGGELDPVVRGQWPGYRRGPVNDVTVSGSYVYVAAGGLQVIDIADAADPHWVGGCLTNGTASGVTLSGNYAYVADGSSLAMIDVSSPAQPQRLGTYATNGWYAAGVAVSGDYAYMADGAGLMTIDISNPAHPYRVGGNSSIARSYGVVLSQGKVFVAAAQDGLVILEMLPFIKSTIHRDCQVQISWEGFGAPVLLQKTARLTAPDWWTIPGSDTTNNMALPASSLDAEFFRLVKP